MKSSPPLPPSLPLTHGRGSVLPIALILLVILTTSAIGFLKLMNASTDVTRQVSFQRDAVNRSELAVNRAICEFEDSSGHFAGLANTVSDSLGSGSGLAYSATALPSDSQGIPDVLKSDAAYATRFGAVLATTVIDSGDTMTTRLVIERLCSLEEAADASHCAVGAARAPDQCSRCALAVSPPVPIFRVTARTTGARGVEAYVQSTFSVPFE